MTRPLPAPAPDLAPRLSERLATLGYTVDAVWDRIGEAGQRGLGRNSTVAADRALGDAPADPLATLTRFWLLQQPVDADRLDAALPGLVASLVEAGFATAAGSRATALVDVRPYATDATDDAPAWVVSDLTPGLDGPPAAALADHVLGVSPASTTLAELTLRAPVARALDLGTGCGVQALHLAGHADKVVGTDVNPRALALARFTLDLNALGRVDLHEGSLYAPVADESFDLIVTNPPFVMSPPGGRLVYREGDRPGDDLVRAVVGEGASRLAPGGTLQVLANWAHVGDQPWSERLDAWIAPSGCDAFVIERETLDVYEYIEIWLADAGLFGQPGYAAAYRRWLDYFAALDVRAVGMGWLNLRRPRHPGRRPAERRLESWPHAVQQPVAGAIGAYFDGLDLAALAPHEWLAQHLVLVDGVVQETLGQPGAPDPAHLVLRQSTGLRRGLEPGTLLAAFLGACDGDLSVGRLLAALSGVLGVDPAEATSAIVQRLPDLVREGYLGASPRAGRSTP